MFNVIVVKDYQELSQKAFEVVKGVLNEKKTPVLGLATGSSPLGLYQAMIDDHKKNQTDYSKVITFNLDEYVGLPREHQESYYTFMHHNLFDHLNIKEEHVHLPSGLGDLEENSKAYEALMANYQIDLQLLGIGSNGHIGFNEPGTPFDSLTHVVTLKESTRKDNARFFEPLKEEVPTHAITMGIQSVLKAKKILLIASGKNKAQAIYNMLKGPVTPEHPASVLQNHPDVIVIVDKEAASLL